MARQSETSMTKYDDLPRTYATLCFAGDDLDPSHISAILPVPPKRSHRKGETFHAGARAGDLIGRTGIWYFDTSDLPSHDLSEHLRRIVSLLYSRTDDNALRLNRLREVMTRERAAAHVSCFWYGKAGMQQPIVPNDVRLALESLPADIETEFHTASVCDEGGNGR